MPKTQETAPEARYDARPELMETFADKAQRLTFDGRTLRIEFCVERPEGETGKVATPVCRLVLDLDGAVDLFNKINTIQAALESRGVIKTQRADAA